VYLDSCTWLNIIFLIFDKEELENKYFWQLPKLLRIRESWKVANFCLGELSYFSKKGRFFRAFISAIFLF
jgi:hypothetical protein